MAKSRRRRKSRAGGIVLVLLVLIILGFGGWKIYRIIGPNTEEADIADLFGVNEEQTAIMYNYELQKATGIRENGTCYLPGDWVQTILNKRFYWDEDEHLMVYVMPGEVVRMDSRMTGEDGKRLLIEAEGKVWISTDVIRKYTDVRIEEFSDRDVSRVFVTTPDFYGESVCGVRGKTALRTRTSYKGYVITEVAKGSKVRVVPEHPNSAPNEVWQRVMTPDGFTGYIRRSRLYEAEASDYDSGFRAPDYGRTPAEKTPVLLGWHQVTNKDANRYLAGLTANAAGLTVVAPTWFSLRGNEGLYECYADASYVDSAHEKGVQVWALIENLDDSVTLGTLLKKTAVRRKLIAQIMADAEFYGIDGINVDFEYLRGDAAKAYLEFIRELSVPCREKGLVLSVDVPNAASYNTHYDRGELAVFCDYVINMGYDEHTAGDDPGSTSSLPFFRDGLERTLTEVPAERLIAGIPFYTRAWTVTSEGRVSSEALSMAGAAAWAEEQGIVLKWDPDLGQSTGSVTSESGTVRSIWMEDDASEKERVQAAREYSVAGIACWRLGFEEESVWKILSPDAQTGQ